MSLQGADLSGLPEDRRRVPVAIKPGIVSAVCDPMKMHPCRAMADLDRPAAKHPEDFEGQGGGGAQAVRKGWAKE